MTQPQAQSDTARVTRRRALVAAGIVLSLAAAGAVFQQPHPDPLRVTQAQHAAGFMQRCDV